MDIWMILVAAGMLAVSGVPGLVFGRHSVIGQWIAACLVVLGATLGLCSAVAGLTMSSPGSIDLPWFLPWGRFTVALDALSSLFLLPIFLISALGSIYGLSYWKQSEHPSNGRKLALFYGLLAASMVLVVLARDGILFLMAWEAMALSAFFLVTTEDDDRAVCQAGWIYLAATHLGTLCLLAMFGLMHMAIGSFAIEAAFPATMSPDLSLAIFLLAVVGFGMKAGVMPLHVWLPGAHANAPTHVSAVLSGVMIKMGIYGLIRIAGMFPHPPVSWGGLLLALGAISALLGILFAISQSDLKRLLAYSSIENIGIILLGVGLAMIGRSMDRPDWIALGMAGALLHVLNHSLFKPLLFYASGSVIHAMHTRQLDRMGGLATRMPLTATAFLVGAVAICGLPSLNGFISELFIYLGLFSTLGGGPGAAASIAAPLLAMVGALAVACFVKVFGTAFLGQGRTEAANHAHESSVGMLFPMAVLVVGCFGVGLLPVLVSPMLDRAVAAWAPKVELSRIADLVPLGTFGLIATVLLATLFLGVLFLRRRMRQGSVGTWDCGYIAPTARMQYSASSFAQILVDLFGWVLRTRKHPAHVNGLFPQHSRFESHTPDTVLSGAILPTLRNVQAIVLRMRSLVRGRSQLYVFYIMAIIVVLLIMAGRETGGDTTASPLDAAGSAPASRPASSDASRSLESVVQ